MKRLSAIALMLIVVSALSFTAYAQKDMQHARAGFIKKLNLTDEQKDKVHVFQEKHEKTMIDLKADLQKAVIDKREIVRKGNIDRKSFLDANDKIMNIKNKIGSEMANHKMDIYAILTPEQKQKAEKMAVFFFDNHKMGKGEFGRHGWGGPGAGHDKPMHDDKKK